MKNATTGIIVAWASLVVGIFATSASAEPRGQGWTVGVVQLAQYAGGRDNTADPGSAPLASPTGGRPVPVDRSEVRRDNTRDPGSAPSASPSGGRPVPVDPAEVRRDNTRDPG